MSFVDRNLAMNQMRLFVHSDDLKASVNSGEIGANDATQYASPQEMWDHKEREARRPKNPDVWQHAAGLYNAVKRDGGVQRPVIMSFSGGKKEDTQLSLADGHHRVATASALARDAGQSGFVPVKYENE